MNLRFKTTKEEEDERRGRRRRRMRRRRRRWSCNLITAMTGSVAVDSMV